MLERPGSGERALLLHIGLNRAVRRRRDPGVQALARSAGADIVDELTARRDRPRPACLSARVKPRSSSPVERPAQSSSSSINRYARARNEISSSCSKPVCWIATAYSRYLRPARGDLRRQDSGRARAARASVDAIWCGAGLISRRQKGGIGLRGPGETQLETDRRLSESAHQTSQGQAGSRRETARDGPARSQSGPGRDGRAGRLHERGKDQPVQCAKRGAGERDEPVVRDARSDDPPPRRPVESRDPAGGYGRVRPGSAARTRRGVSRDPDGDTRSELLLHVIDVERSSPRRPEASRSRRVLESIGAAIRALHPGVQ